MIEKFTKESRAIMTGLVLPNDTNNHQTLFGGVLMKNMDAIASISARKHCRREVVTASTDSVDFLSPIYPSDSVCLESFVTWTGKTSMEVFVKVLAENLLSGEKRIAATAFLTFVMLEKSEVVPSVVAETEEEIYLHETAFARATIRKERRKKSLELAKFITIDSD